MYFNLSIDTWNVFPFVLGPFFNHLMVFVTASQCLLIILQHILSYFPTLNYQNYPMCSPLFCMHFTTILQCLITVSPPYMIPYLSELHFFLNKEYSKYSTISCCYCCPHPADIFHVCANFLQNIQFPLFKRKKYNKECCPIKGLLKETSISE